MAPRRTLAMAVALIALPLGAGAGTAAGPASRAVPAADPVVAAAGDIACDPADADFNGGDGTATKCRQKATAALLAGADAVLPVGDVQYEDGTYPAFLSSYDPSWGAYKAITFPVPGDHDYVTPGAAGYFQYFGAAAGDPAKGYYSFDLGDWHLIALNSACAEVGGCHDGSPQEVWLEADLAASTAPCTLAYWHNPRFSSGPNGSDPTYDAFWRTLYAAGADIVLGGDDHDYERFAKQDPDAQANPGGIREFIVGTGGKSHLPFFQDIQPNTEVRNRVTFGVLKLTLHATSYDWAFVPEAGATFTDAGTATCSGSPTAATVTSVAATRVPRGVRLAWETQSETRTLGYNLDRVQRGKRVRLNRVLIPASSRPGGHSYSWLDRTFAGGPARYSLELVGVDGRRRSFGPVVVPG